MKYFIVSDIHGSSYYFKQALKFYDEFDCDYLIILGDLLYHGPRNDLPEGFNVKELVKLLNERKKFIICVKGNCDSEVDQMVLEFPINDMVMLNCFNKNILMTHGHKYSVENPFKIKSDIVLYGHFHIPDYRKIENTIYFNPGSISLPKKNSPHSFAIMDEEGIKLYSCDGELLNVYNY